MPYCHQCGTEVQGSDLFCAKCGEQQRQEASKIERPETGLDEIVEEKVVDLQYRGVGIRFVATIIDGLVCLMIFWLVGSVIASMVGGTTADGFEVQGAPAVMVQALTALLCILYYTVLESSWNGQTLGKKAVRIQVLNTDGTPVSFSTALIRNILRFIDGFGFYVVAAISVWLSPTKQRIGDRVAKTCVVRKVDLLPLSGTKNKKFKLTSKDDVYISDID